MRILLAAALTASLGLAACAHASPAHHGPFSCAVRGQTVVVTLSGTRLKGTRNPRHFGISHGKAFIYLNASDVQANFTPYNTQTRQLRLPIASQQGIVMVDGSPSTVKVFTQPGHYQLLFADNLETEPDSTFSLQCAVTLKASAFK